MPRAGASIARHSSACSMSARRTTRSFRFLTVNQWITDQVMDIEVPEALKPLDRALGDLFAPVQA